MRHAGMNLAESDKSFERGIAHVGLLAIGP